MKLSFSIIIPNYNGRKLLEHYLPNVMEVVRGNEVIMTDDASTDDSIVYVSQAYPDIHIVRSTVNSGFSSNVNRGVAEASGDIVVLLNTDVVPERGFLTFIREQFSDSNVFAVGCLEKSHEKGQIVIRGRGIGGWKNGNFIHNRGEINTSTTAWVSGGSGAYKKEIWRKLGGMDTMMNPFYWEDIDLSYRARKRGYRILFESRSIVHHYHEEGIIKTGFAGDRINFQAFRNQLIFTWKNLTDKVIMKEHLWWLLRRLVRSIIIWDPIFIGASLSAFMCLPRILWYRIHSGQDGKVQDRELDILS